MVAVARVLGVTAVSMLAAGLVAGTAQATPGSGVSATLISQQTVGDTDLVVREITIEPGGSTGYHFHDGTVYGLIRRGELTHIEADCTTVRTYRPGELVVEPAGRANVHIGRNLGTEPVVLDALYVLPTGSPLAEDAPAPACAAEATP
jgi:quercetin dioxygenase-like cupin family protein